MLGTDSFFFTMKSYSEKLRDPRWQRKRLEVLDRDQFKCVRCGDDKSELNVHHKFYDGREPWMYELDELETVCRPCHEAEHGRQPERIGEPVHIGSLIEQIRLTRALIPNTEAPNSEWIEERLDKMTAELNTNLNNEDRG